MNTRRIFILVPALAAAVVVAATAYADGLVFPPKDDAAKDPSFVAYRAALMTAVKNRNINKVVAAAAPNIKLSFRGVQGRATLRAWLSGNGTIRAAFYWRELETILRLGGTFDKLGQFCAPYVSCVDASPCAKCEASDIFFVINKKAPVHAKPDGASRVVSQLTYNVLQADETETPNGWVAVRLPGRGMGFMRSRDVRTPVNYRAYFEKVGGAWQMVIFLKGT